MHLRCMELFVARGHGGVDGEYGIFGDVGSGFSHVHALGQCFLQSLQEQKGRVTFIEMVGGHVDVQMRQQHHAPNAQKNFLSQTYFAVWDIEVVGDGPQMRWVFGNIAVQKKEWGATHHGQPGGEVDVAVGIRD